jgi:hypothetical protein
VSDSSQWFDHQIADLSPPQRAALEQSLRAEGIPATFGPAAVRTDMAYEARVSTLIDQARSVDYPAPQAGTPPAYPATGYPSPAYPTAGYPAPGYGAAGASTPTNSNAVLALVLGLISLVLGLSCGIGLLAGPFAVVVGQKARREISRTGEQGDGMALAGVITGAIATALLVIGVVVLVVVIIIAAASSS